MTEVNSCRAQMKNSKNIFLYILFCFIFGEKNKYFKNYICFTQLIKGNTFPTRNKITITNFYFIFLKKKPTNLYILFVNHMPNGPATLIVKKIGTQCSLFKH